MPENGANGKADLELFSTEQTRRHYLEGTRWWVELKRELDLGEESELESAALRGVEVDILRQGAAATNRALGVMDLGRQRILKLALYVVDWNFADPDGRPVELPFELHQRMEIMKRLSARVGMMVVEIIDRQRNEDAAANEDPADEAQNESPKPTASGGTPGTTPSLPSAGTWAAGRPPTSGD